MARMGKKYQQKRLSAPKSYKIHRKEAPWTIKMMPGAHKTTNATALGVILRDILHLADNRFEAEYIAKNGNIIIDGKVRRDIRAPVGLFDMLEIPKIGKKYRIIFDKKARIIPKEIAKDSAQVKLVKITSKRVIRSGKIQLGTHDGRNIVLPADEGRKYKVGDSVKIKLPEQNREAVYPYEQGALAYILKGKHAGSMGTIEQIVPGSISKDPEAIINIEGQVFPIVKENIIIVGKDKPEIEL